MKKMIMVLMMVFGLSAAFAKQIIAEDDNYILITDDENVQPDFSGKDDLDIVATVISSMPKKTDKYKIEYVTFEIEEVDKVSKKYFNYFVYSKDETHFMLFQNLGDGRQLMVFYQLKK